MQVRIFIRVPVILPTGAWQFLFTLHCHSWSIREQLLVVFPASFASFLRQKQDYRPSKIEPFSSKLFSPSFILTRTTTPPN
jgi:hypothetical protein